ncbi:hypothetical protein MTO96_003967 [Rhipicephalus appendiculatus]
MERKQDHSSCPGDIAAGHRRRTNSNSTQAGECQSAPATLESAPSLLRHDGSRSSDSFVSTDDQNIRDFKPSPLSPTLHEAAEAEESSELELSMISSEELSMISPEASWENSLGNESKSTPSPFSNQECTSPDEASPKEPTGMPVEAREDQRSSRESESSASCSGVLVRTGALATTRSEPYTIPLEPSRQPDATASGKCAMTEQDDPRMGQAKLIYASLSQAPMLAESREDLSTPSTSLELTGTQGRKQCTTATHETAGGISVAAQLEYPRTDSTPVPSRDPQVRWHVQSIDDINIGASASQGMVGIQDRKRSVTAVQDIRAATSTAAQFGDPRYYAPHPGPPSQVSGHLCSRDGFNAPSTSKGRAVYQGRGRSATASHEATRGRIVTAQMDNPREEHYAHGRRLESWAKEPSESEEFTPCTSKGRAGTKRREPGSTAYDEKAGKRYLAAQQLRSPIRRQQSQWQQYAESDDCAPSTPKVSAGIQGGEHSLVASTSRADLVPGDIQGQFPVKEHRRTKGA